MFIEHVIQYHLEKARELEDEYKLDRRRTRVKDAANRHITTAYTMRKWPDYIDFTEMVAANNNNQHGPTHFNSHRR